MDLPAGVTRIATDRPDVYAFRVTGQLNREGMEKMAAEMNAAFDTHQGVNVLFLLEDFDLGDAAIGYGSQSMKADLRSITNVDRYAVVGGPKVAQTMIESFGRVIPVDAKTFPQEDEDAAWAFVGARPV
ncbi:STAS/SEC14 domain-containing protein [Tranquillimonas alkanivorans]|uniref:SpoIIAA-like n=1 Tax=Tranquillimonas alkanivorans TaxID=441119 RepID=A0A1I5RDK6_9RHOB|nr:STAS/SEC14 domain-containing protein [Tranquillimonas alkanivorans]SFP56668.1 SpoIIAA-like [Tranquillimonas alkanivorans]